MAAWAARRRTISRSPGNTSLTARSSVPRQTANQTVPTGFSSVPPPGPATPVTPIPASAPKRSRAIRAQMRRPALRPPVYLIPSG